MQVERVDRGRVPGGGLMDRGVTPEHVRDVVAIGDPVLRNYWVTQTYADLSMALARVLDPNTANWCTFAAWASRTVGENLRGEHLPAWLRQRVTGDDGMMGAIDEATVRQHDTPSLSEVDDLAPDHIMDLVRDAFGATADNLSEGNTEVFAEIGGAASVFVAAYAADSPLSPAEARAQVLDACAAAPLFDGVNHLQAGYASWCDAVATDDPRVRSQLILAGSLQLGAHEQNRLQPAVANSMDMGVNRATGQLAQHLAAASGWLGPLVRDLERAVEPVGASLARLWDDVMTEFVAVADSPDGPLRLGHDIPPLPGQPFSPPDLDAPWSAELSALLQRFDRSHGDGRGTKARDWVEFDDRMNFILNLFRSRHHHRPMFDPPFPPEVVRQLEAGGLPGQLGGVDGG
jgi:hypothetical protein